MTENEASFILANIDRRVCDDELSDALDMAIKALEQTRWIPISERLPEDGTWNYFTDGKHISVERYKSDAIDHFFPNGRWFSLEEAVAWMPLPEIQDRKRGGNMQIVIKLSESDYEDVKKHPGSYSFGEAIKNGVVLPRWHGRLIDADKATICCLEHTGKRSLLIDLAPTVIGADISGKEQE